MLPTLVLLTLKATLLLAAAALAAASLRRQSAASRHLVWSVTFGGILLLAAASPFAAPRGLRLEMSLPKATAPTLRAWAPLVGEIHGEAGRSVTPAERSFRVADAIVALWLAGVALLALRSVAGHAALRGVAARARTIETGPRARLVETDEISVPATWGLLRPIVALPANAREWPSSRRDTAIAHELAHVRRRDVLTQSVADACCALFWFHPGVWLAARAMRAECERACDDAVIAAGAERLLYAETLLAVAGSASMRPSRLVGHVRATSGVRELEGRLRSILDSATRRASPRLLVAAVPAIAATLTVVLAALELRASALPVLDSREEVTFARLREAAQHEKLHPADLIRERAVWALSIAESDRVIAPLISRLSDPDGRLREHAAWALRLSGAPEAIEPLERCLNDPEWRVREQAVWALADLGDPDASIRVVPLLDDPAWQVRSAAVAYLARFGSSRDLAAVRERSNDPHIAVRSAVTAALGEP